MFRGFAKRKTEGPPGKRVKVVHLGSGESVSSKSSSSATNTTSTGSNSSKSSGCSGGSGGSTTTTATVGRAVSSPAIPTTTASKAGNGALATTTNTPRRAASTSSLRSIKSNISSPGLDDQYDKDGEDVSPEEDSVDTSIDAAFPTFSEEEYTAAFRPKSISVYVKAFMFALETVLEHESHLFDEKEMEIFGRFRSLPYESQYLYVRLFLRKSNAFFRLDKLKYYSDISSLPKASAPLQDPEVGLADSEEAFSSLEEAAEMLSLDELKSIAKEAKITAPTKSALITSLAKSSSNQTALASNGGLGLEFSTQGAARNRDRYFMGKILALLGPCIRLRAEPASLFNRVHLIFYRSTEYTEKSLRTVVLARMSKKNFPDYFVSRTANIFPTREALLEFEKAIKLQAEVDQLLQEMGVPTKEGLERVLEIFEKVYPRWEELVIEEATKTRETKSEDGLMERVYLRRFNAGWVYTRLVHKGLYVLARKKEYKREHDTLSALLAQRFFHGARRGAWYVRRALVEENYMSSLPHGNLIPSSETAKKFWRREAWDTCVRGLRDPSTHVTFHHELQKRILKLEKKLKIPHRLQHDFGHAQLLTPSKRVIYGTKLSETALGRKTVWKDPADGTRCSVEEMCLSTYRLEGWKGYHCEGRLLTTLFAYLFYDILFCYCPNVFETEYQTAPLDLFTDAFYPARASEVNHRLAELSNGGARKFIEAVDDEQRARQTCVVGLDWSFAREDLLEIVEAIGGGVLSVVCKVFCEEYAQRTGGLPDLFLWRMDGEGGKPEARFVEVKSENDRLSETQRLWIHVLSSAGAKVELCSALEVGRKSM